MSEFNDLKNAIIGAMDEMSKGDRKEFWDSLEPKKKKKKDCKCKDEEVEVNETIPANATCREIIHDFAHSKSGHLSKDKNTRIKQALAVCRKRGVYNDGSTNEGKVIGQGRFKFQSRQAAQDYYPKPKSDFMRDVLYRKSLDVAPHAPPSEKIARRMKHNLRRMETAGKEADVPHHHIAKKIGAELKKKFAATGDEVKKTHEYIKKNAGKWKEGAKLGPLGWPVKNIKALADKINKKNEEVELGELRMPWANMDDADAANERYKKNRAAEKAKLLAAKPQKEKQWSWTFRGGLRHEEVEPIDELSRKKLGDVAIKMLHDKSGKDRGKLAKGVYDRLGGHYQVKDKKGFIRMKKYKTDEIHEQQQDENDPEIAAQQKDADLATRAKRTAYYKLYGRYRLKKPANNTPKYANQAEGMSHKRASEILYAYEQFKQNVETELVDEGRKRKSLGAYIWGAELEKTRPGSTFLGKGDKSPVKPESVNKAKAVANKTGKPAPTDPMHKLSKKTAKWQKDNPDRGWLTGQKNEEAEPIEESLIFGTQDFDKLKGAVMNAMDEVLCERQHNGHDKEEGAGKCKWFAGCGNPATTTRSHPTLGKVAICARCQKKMDSIEGKTKKHEEFDMSEASINFDPGKYQALRKRYQEAVASGQEQFTFDGHQFLTSYARYLLEYLKLRGMDKKQQ